MSGQIPVLPGGAVKKATCLRLVAPTLLRQLLVFVPIALTWLVRTQAVVSLGKLGHDAW